MHVQFLLPLLVNKWHLTNLCVCRNPVIAENNNEPATVPINYLALGRNQCRQLFDGYLEARNSGDANLRRIFKLRIGGNGAETKYSDAQLNEFRTDFTTSFRDMRSCGVAAMHCGFPLWQLVDKYSLVDRQFRRKKGDFIKRVGVLTKVGSSICLVTSLNC